MAHSAYYNEQKEKVPSVTTVLSIINQPELVKWANNIGLRGIKVDEYNNSAKRIGTLTHSLLEYAVTSSTPEEVLNNLELSIQAEANTLEFECMENQIAEWKVCTQEEHIATLNPITQFVKWWMDNHMSRDRVLMAEQKFSCKEYGGTIDMLAKVNDEITLIDFKTSGRIIPSYMMQVSAYKFLLEINNHPVDQLSILRLPKNTGNYEYVKIEPIHVPVYEQTFWMALNLYNTMKRVKEVI